MAQNPRVYLDYNATAPLRPEARDAMLAAMATLGNPSSIHAEGRAARAVVEEARATIATAIGAEPRNVIFTSGATEAANLALTPHIQLGRDERPFDILLIAGGEHPCVHAGHRFPPESVEILPLTPQGRLSLDVLAAALMRHSGRRVVLALQAANHETGAMQPVAEAAGLVHAAGGLLVCDATQAMGRADATFAELAADMIFFSAHKLGGPMGAGALAFGRGDLHIRETVLRGGGQERGRRAGTENISAIVGFAAAFGVACEEGKKEAIRLAKLRDDVERRVTEILPQAEFLGAGVPRLANTSAFLAPGIPAQTLAMALDLEGVAVSPGSACSSGKAQASKVLAAMGRSEPAALRISLGWSSTAMDVERLGDALGRVVERIKTRRATA